MGKVGLRGLKTRREGKELPGPTLRQVEDVYISTTPNLDAQSQPSVLTTYRANNGGFHLLRKFISYIYTRGYLLSPVCAYIQNVSFPRSLCSVSHSTWSIIFFYLIYFWVILKFQVYFACLPMTMEKVVSRRGWMNERGKVMEIFVCGYVSEPFTV